MTIIGWGMFIFFTVLIIGCCTALGGACDHWVAGIIVGLVLTAILFGGMWWYYHNTASGVRAVTDQRSELTNGLERTVTVYTANGDIIAQYKGRIDIEGNDGGYVLFDYDGHRYTYYNCFVESIAEID